MPTTFVGLLISIAFLTPGFLYASQRRVLVPQGERSTLMETTSVLAISLATNAVTAAVFGLLRGLLPRHTPDIGLLLSPRSAYWLAHLPYVLSWGAVLLTASCALAATTARWEWLRRMVSRPFTPVILESSAWCETFAAPDGCYPHAGLELAAGAFVSGRVVWFSTDLEETGDRDLVLGPPLAVRTDAGIAVLESQRVIVAARDIRRIDIAYVVESPGAPD